MVILKMKTEETYLVSLGRDSMDQVMKARLGRLIFGDLNSTVAAVEVLRRERK